MRADASGRPSPAGGRSHSIIGCGSLADAYSWACRTRLSWTFDLQHHAASALYNVPRHASRLCLVQPRPAEKPKSSSLSAMQMLFLTMMHGLGIRRNRRKPQETSGLWRR